MSFFKALFGGKIETPEEKEKAEEEKNFEVLKYDGVRAMRSGNMDYAVKCFRHALEFKDDLEIHDYLSQVLINSNELMKAMEELQVLADACPDNSQVLTHMANVAYMMEDYAKMEEVCGKAIQIDGDNPQNWYLQAMANKGLGNTVAAVAMFTKAIALDENYGSAYLQRGMTLLGIGDVPGAKKDADWLVERVADNEDVLLFKARVEHASGNADVAKDIYTNVIDLNPFSVDAYIERGRILMETGDKFGAAADLKKALELNPESASAVSGEFSTGKE